jgi:hypothetical protein
MEESMSDNLNWLGINLDSLVLEVQKRTSKSLEGSRELSQDIIRINPVFRTAFKHWWETGNLQDVGEYSGYTLNDLVTGIKGTGKLNPIGAFLTLDWLSREPEKASAAIKQGYDTIIPMKSPS